MDFKTYLSLTSKKIDTYSESFFKKWGEQISSQLPELTSLNSKFIERARGGKMLRGSLIGLGYKLIQKTPNEKFLLPALAIEILHTGLLIHDDIMDKSTMRRGRPTLYRALGGNHYGTSQAICMGDLAFFLALKMLSESKFEESRKNQAITLLTRTINSTIFGQMLDIEICQNSTPDIQTVLKMYKLKTAYYTISCPLSIGGLIGGADKKWLKNVEKFGENLGTAFQIQDDILGIFGSKKTVGKPTTSDIEEGKNTVLYIHALTTLSGNNKKKLKELYGKKGINNSEHAEIKKIFQECGSLHYAQSLAKDFVQKSQKIIPQLTQSQKNRQLLTSLTEMVINRQK